MDWLRTLTAVGVVVATALFSGHGSVQPVAAKTQILAGTTLEADEQTVADILAVFDRAEKAIESRDLDGLMALYSKSYNYHGLHKSDIRKIWSDLFEQYRNIESVHLFTRIMKVGDGSDTIVEMTCTGSLRAVSKTSNLRVPIDSWYGEVHYLAQEDGAWRIRGNVGDRPTVLPFGTAPHPLF
ncbi:MAG: hypothetical protein HY444_08985 [Nitrospirae bacterium]|nr:hypothetical protein [Nitrospirota bacterium]